MPTGATPTGATPAGATATGATATGATATGATAHLTARELLTTTRSVRRRLDLSRPVCVELVRACLRVALQAPNGGNNQRWRWLVVTEPALRMAIAQIYRAAFHARYPADAALSPEQSRQLSPEQSRQLSSARYLADHLGQVPVLVIPCLELDQARLPEGNQAGLWGSLLPAAWSYMLAARYRGLGTAWTTVHLDRETEVAELLGLPATVRQGALLPTAYYLGDTFRPAPRADLDEVLHVNGWRRT